MMSNMQLHELQSILQKCRYEMNLDTQVEMLFQLNSFLPAKARLKLPSLFTDDYIRKALDTIEEKLHAYQYPNYC